MLGPYVTRGSLVALLTLDWRSDFVDVPPRAVTRLAWTLPSRRHARAEWDERGGSPRRSLLCLVGWPYPSDGSEHIAWIRAYWPSLEPYMRGFYVNDLDPNASPEVINENYRENYDRLARVKDRCDLTNLFRLNAKVEPSA